MHALTFKLSKIIENLLKEVSESITYFYDYFILRTPVNLSWFYRYIDKDTVGVKLKDETGREIAKVEGNILLITGNCKAKFYVDSYVSIRKIRKFILKWLKRERNVSLRFDPSFLLLTYDCLNEEQSYAINCKGIWHKRDNRRWLEDLNGKIIAEYDVNSCEYKYLKGDWKTIDSINIIWNSEEDFRNFIERHVSLGAKEII